MLGTDEPITVVQPFDWVGSVLVPVAAILVSAGIALWLARKERLRSERLLRQESVVATIKALTKLGSVALSNASVEELHSQLNAVGAEINGLAAVIPRRAEPVPRYLGIVLASLDDKGPRNRIANTAMFLSTAAESWARGIKKPRDFRDAMHDDPENIWASSVDLTRWRQVLAGTATREEVIRK